MSKLPPEKVVITPEEFAALFGKSQTWGYRQLYAGKVKVITGYGRLMIPASEVERLLESAAPYEGAAYGKAEELRVSRKQKRASSKNRWKNALRKHRSRQAKSSQRQRGDLAKVSAAKRSALRKLNRSGG
ncbi:MAG: hypothetical protein AAF558_13880 [Verrucomicrobiota bacterium]